MNCDECLSDDLGYTLTGLPKLVYPVLLSSGMLPCRDERFRHCPPGYRSRKQNRADPGRFPGLAGLQCDFAENDPARVESHVDYNRNSPLSGRFFRENPIRHNLQRVFLAGAIALTIVLLWAGIVPAAGQALRGGSHWLAHFVSFAILAFAWRCGLPRIPAFIVMLAVIAFGFAHEAIEVVGHAHAYELGDAVVDAIGAIAGILPGYLPTGLFGPKAEDLPPS